MRPNNLTRRRGSTALLAMLFLVLFSCLAVGFYCSVTASVQVAKNEAGVARAQLAADSGLQFLRYQLATLDIPPGTGDGAVAAEIAGDLQAKLHDTANLGAGTITRAGNVITIPPIALEGPAAAAPGRPPDSFVGRLEWVPAAPPAGSYLRATVTGRSGTGGSFVDRAVRLDYHIEGKSTTLFDYGIASKGAVTIKSSNQTNVLGTPDASASILSAAKSAVSITTGKGVVDGSLAVVLAKSQVSLGSGPVGQSGNTAVILENHVKVVPAPDFPVVDTTPFKALATNLYVSGATYQKNIRVPANTNPRFTGGDVVEGILYVESPNSVVFRGHCTINGVIVFENKNGVAENVLDFKGNVSPSAMPNSAEFAAVRAATKGWAILAPSASVAMSGSVDGNVTGTIMARKVAFNGSADLTLNQGTVVSLGPDATDIGGKTIHFKGTGAADPPTTGLTFSGSFRPDAASYFEPQ